MTTRSQALAQMDALLDTTLSSAGSALADLRALERLRNRMAALEHVLIAEIDQELRDGRLPAMTLSGVLISALRVHPAEAAARIDAATDLGPRRSFLGEALAPIFPVVAAAEAAGEISVRHARVITSTVYALPAAVQTEHGAAVEAMLVEQASIFDPQTLGRLAREIQTRLDPDGRLTDDADQTRRRELRLRELDDGAYAISGRLTPACGALVRDALDPLSAPNPGDAQRDQRSPAQRRHDALEDLATRALATGDLPALGAPATLLITVSCDELVARTGMASTGFGGELSIAEALRLSGETHLVAAARSMREGITCYGRDRRIASYGQTLALAARDGGCSFPGCDRPPSWCQRHHVVPWIDGGPTDLSNLTLVCGYHHRSFERAGWTVRIERGHAWWTPPSWVDPGQTPIRNTMHRPLELMASDGPSP